MRLRRNIVRLSQRLRRHEPRRAQLNMHRNAKTVMSLLRDLRARGLAGSVGSQRAFSEELIAGNAFVL